MTRCAETGLVPPASGVTVSAAALPAGFFIQEICEPVPEEWVIEKVPAWVKEYIKPNFLVVKAKKI